MSTIERRRQELEEKKRKLAEMKRAREERMAALKGVVSGDTAANSVEAHARPATPLTSNRKEIDDLVNNLLGSSGAGASTITRASTPVGQGNVGSDGRSLSMELQSVGAGPSRVSTPVVGEGEHVTDSSLGAEAMQDLTDQMVELYELPSKPKVMMTYSRGIQTSKSTYKTTEGSRNDIFDDPDSVNGDQVGRETEAEMKARLLALLEEERAKLDAEIKDEEEKKRQEEQRIIGADFAQFVEDSTKIVQRALNDNYDYAKDYRIVADTSDDDTSEDGLKLVCTFSDQRWTSGRSTTALEWSYKFPELVAAGYNRKEGALSEPDGIVAIWNTYLLDRPEFVFHAASAVLSIAFSPFNPNLIFGGTYSGQVLLWDTRAKSAPVLKTPLTGLGHRHPIYALQVVGSQNAHNLISSSTDGTVCTWLTDMLAKPQEVLELTNPTQTRTNELSITCMDLPPNDTSTIWVGAEDGGVYQVHRQDRAGMKAGVDPKNMHRAHTAPVTAIDFHPNQGGSDLSDLFLTSGMDWSVKLWRTAASNRSGQPNAQSSTGRPIEGLQRPIHSFEEYDDYVYDARWHPYHPAIFGTVDGTGNFGIWHLNQDAEAPYQTVSPGAEALVKLAWEKKEGRRAAVGSTNGSVHIYDIGEVATAGEGDVNAFHRTLQDLSAQQTTFRPDAVPVAAGPTRVSSASYR